MDGSSEGNDRPFPQCGTVTDLRTLDCQICCNPLTIPTYQCLNGHVACWDCWPRLKGRCPSCKEPLDSNRCRAVEKILECLTVRCPNQDLGCKEIVLYEKLRLHLVFDCEGSPCQCPHLCSFKGTSKEVYSHYINSHSQMTMTQNMFFFGKPKDVLVPISHKVSVIYSIGTPILFVLQCFRETKGVYVDITMIASMAVEGKFRYKASYTFEDETIVHYSADLKRVLKIGFQTPLVGSCCFIPNHMFAGEAIWISVIIWRE